MVSRFRLTLCYHHITNLQSNRYINLSDITGQNNKDRLLFSDILLIWNRSKFDAWQITARSNLQIIEIKVLRLGQIVSKENMFNRDLFRQY